MGIAVLGPLRVDGRVDGLTRRDRVVLAALVARAGEPLSPDALADALWGEDLPASWVKVVQGCVVRLRKRLGTAAIESGSLGYRLALSDDELDACVFERLLERARDALTGGDPGRAAHLAREALSLWHGRALEDLVEWEPGRVEAERLEGLRGDAEELLVEAETGAGRARAVLERARAMVAQAPYRERRWVLLATALYQSGRQAEALGAVQRARTMLADELGLDAGRDLVELEERLLRQDPGLTPPVVTRVSRVCPYRGLLPYGTQDADSFFGREDDEAACLRRLRDTGVLAVVGPSGVGKSSLVRAAVVASLVRDGTPVLVTTPGGHPAGSLGDLKPRGRQTLVVDQAEEAVTLCQDAAERERYFAQLTTHVGAGGRLVVSLRADHLGEFAPYPDFARVLEDGMYLLGPMSEPDLRSAIEGPARRAGLRLEPGLVDLLVREVEGAPAALPLLSYVLSATWQRREGATLTVQGYRATGGVRQAVARSAETLYEAMDAPQRGRLRSLLLRLVVPTDDGDAVRVRVSRAKVAVDEDHARLVEQLVEARLVSIDGETVEIAHEALVRVWPRLRGWLDEDTEGQRIRRHLTLAADTWDAMGRPDSELYRGTRLAQALQWREQAGPDLTPTEGAFLDTGHERARAEERTVLQQAQRQRRVNRRLRGLLAGVVVLLVAALVAGGLAVRQADRAADATRTAEARRVASLSQLTGRTDQSLQLALAAAHVDDSPETFAGLLAALSRHPQLTRLAPAVDGPFVSLDVNPVTGETAVMDRAGRVRLYDDTGAGPSAMFDPHPPGWRSEMWCVCDPVTFSPDGETLAVGLSTLADRPVRLLDASSLRPLPRQLGGQPGYSLPSIAGFSADGRYLAVSYGRFEPDLSGLPPMVVVWDTRAPAAPIRRITAEGDIVHAAISPDGDRVYVGQAWNSGLPAFPLQVFEVSTGRRVASLPGPRGSFRLSPDGSTLAFVGQEDVVLIDAATGAETGRLTGLPASDTGALAFSGDGRLVAATLETGGFAVWEAATGEVREHIDMEQTSLGGDLRFGVDGRRLVVASADGLHLFDLRGGDRYVRRTAPASRAVAAGWDSRHLSPTGDTVLAQLRHGSTQSARRHLIDAGSGTSTPIRGPGWIGTGFTGAWRADGQRVAINATTSVYVADTATGRILSRRRLAAEELEYTRDGTRLLARLAGGYAFLDAETLATLSQPAHDDVANVAGTRLVPTGDSLAVFTADPPRSTFDFTKVKGWALVDTGSGTVRSTGTFGIEPNSGAVSPDGADLAVAGGGAVQIIDLASGEARSSGDAFIETESDGAYLVYSPDGRLLVSSDEAGRLSLWDGRTAAHLGTVRPATSLTSPAFLPDGRTVRVAAADGAIYEWDTSLEHAVRSACRIVGRGLSEDEWNEVLPSTAYRDPCPAE